VAVGVDEAAFEDLENRPEEKRREKYGGESEHEPRKRRGHGCAVCVARERAGKWESRGAT
jgi:hypothetical protein